MTASALYEGWVTHRRVGPHPHEFRYRVFYPLLDLDELPGLFDGIPLWSARRPAPAWFCERDYLPGASDSLSERARTVVEAQLGRRPGGPVQVLANPRYLGIAFNPLSLYFLRADDGRGVDSVIAEVTNTPWRERTSYVLDGIGSGPLRATFDKQMHVSPFQPMDQRYAISVTEPGDRLAISIRNEERGRLVFAATMALQRRPFGRAQALRALASYPPMTVTTLTRIYANALKLARACAPLYPHPGAIPDKGVVRVPRRARGHRRRDHGNRTSRVATRNTTRRYG
jgi:uncharacterized protein